MRHESLAAAANVSKGHGQFQSAVKYLVFEPVKSGLANHMVGMMSTFALSVALGRIFLHGWNSRSDQ